MASEILPLTRDRSVREKPIKGHPDKRRRPIVPSQVQAQRLSSSIEASFTNILDRDDIEVANDPSALAPERALVMKIIGSPKRFVNTAEKIGLEWLAEEVATLHGVRDYFDAGDGADEEDDDDGDIDIEVEDDGGTVDEEVVAESPDDEVAVDDDLVSGAIYLGMPTRETFDKLRSLWRQYAAGKPAPKGFGDWWSLFGLLHELRPWGPEDRIADTTASLLTAERAEHPGEPLQIEADLWYRAEPSKREEAAANFRVGVEEIGGVVLDELRLDEIRYHSLLVRLPGDAIDQLVARSGPLALEDDVMVIRPQSAFRFTVNDPVSEETEDTQDYADTPARPSIAALIDGWPVTNHLKLRNRLDVVELEVADSMAPVNRRYHGTAMASLIVRGDLHEGNGPINRRLKVVPVLVPDGSTETPPQDKLALGVIYRAVRELKEGTGDGEPSGPDVVIINHSICDEAAGFAGAVSAWARLLDYLAWRYRVLFVVSAGNIRDTFPVSGFKTGSEMRLASAEQRRGELLKAIDAAKARRTIFAPAEAVNALTVGAAHRDGSTSALPANNTDPFGDRAAPILSSALGHGFDRSVKPDVILPGGRQIAHPTEGATLLVHGREHSEHFGQRVAMPDPYHAQLTFTRMSSGTSNAAALATRSGLLIADVLDDSPINGETPWYKRDTAPCVLKALIAHGARWDEVGRELIDVHPRTQSRERRKEAVARGMGYGLVDPERIVSGSTTRVTLLAEDHILKNQRHIWKVPLPDALSTSTEFRRIVMTLAWLTPVTPNSSQYRTVALALLGSDGKSAIWPGVKRVGHQPNLRFAKRGTLIHAVYESEKKGRAIPFAPGSDFVINVQAASKMPGVSRERIPYALAVTIEVADTINADIAAQIRERVLPQARVSS